MDEDPQHLPDLPVENAEEDGNKDVNMTAQGDNEDFSITNLLEANGITGEDLLARQIENKVFAAIASETGDNGDACQWPAMTDTVLASQHAERQNEQLVTIDLTQLESLKCTTTDMQPVSIIGESDKVHEVQTGQLQGPVTEAEKQKVNEPASSQQADRSFRTCFLLDDVFTNEELSEHLTDKRIDEYIAILQRRIQILKDMKKENKEVRQNVGRMKHEMAKKQVKKLTKLNKDKSVLQPSEEMDIVKDRCRPKTRLNKALRVPFGSDKVGASSPQIEKDDSRERIKFRFTATDVPSVRKSKTDVSSQKKKTCFATPAQDAGRAVKKVKSTNIDQCSHKEALEKKVKTRKSDTSAQS